MRTRLIAAGAAALLAVAPLAGAQAQELSCTLDFSMSGWSIFYKTASGHGTVRCSNGQSMPVRIETRGGGLTLGRSRIDNGTGTFAGVKHINDVLGGYATAEAHAGLVRSAKAQVVTKGPVTLGLAGTGDGWDLGVAFGSFIISRR
ncbi:hypothetical protein BGP89_06605 [Luteimonas sp. JM171]|uniref:hypothetical protein n=1 Tax=Luteimonas sp. JM171 TaxID=1896164 RepID=UPI0008571AFD|nr:hypothetical protein [Luteimonas sp. JM171]AOH36065.1 hypothetical protein BGP89_06605 [Luteimonas sp. JM171]